MGNKDTPNVAESNDDSDVELDGVDMEDIGEEEEEEEEEEPAEPNNTTKKVAALKTDDDDDDDDDDRKNLEAREEAELEAANRERQELLKSAEGEVIKDGSLDAKMSFLMKQSDVFAQFLAGKVAADSKKKKKSQKGGRGRMSEQEEDARLMKTAQSKVRVVRLDHQPLILAADCKMHPYQLEGLNWLIKLHDHGINGILADEMGLGKTLQTISLLAYLRESRGVHGPHIAIVPKSVVGNWIREFQRWCPSIHAVRMGGTKQERQEFVKNHLHGGFDVLVTSYEGFLKEKSKLGKVKWHYLIIDEAHRIKSPDSSLSKAVRTVGTQFRLLITGTPLQNNLKELWALLNFIMPDIFGDEEYFSQWFSLSDESGKDNVVRKLHTVLRPFMLRRIKKDVAKSLPPKKETKLFIGLTEMQKKWYLTCLQKNVHFLNALGGPTTQSLLNVLMQLRKVCNHPYLFDGAEDGPPYIDGPHLWENSGKMQLLNKLLPKLKSRGSRVLIFSQMTRVLDILEDYMRYKEYEYCRIDGNTDGEKRDSQIDEFNMDGSTKFTMLLSTRAGGLGINLATADIVILFDSDWNPQVDLQAMDRAHRYDNDIFQLIPNAILHRIGQKKPVQVFRFVTEGTVEEKIIERADRKLFLDAAVIQQGRIAEQNSSLEKGELMKMVRFGADQILSGRGGTYTDEDVDALIAKSEEKTASMQAKLETDAKHDLANFSLLAEDEVVDSFSFAGKNYRGSDKRPAPISNFINLPQRQRKRIYDTTAADVAPSKKIEQPRKKPKGQIMNDFQLFDLVELEKLLEKEKKLNEGKEAELLAIQDIRKRADTSDPENKEALLAEAISREQKIFSSFELSDEDKEFKEKLLSEGFADWDRRDFRCFCTSVERHGRYDFNSICRDVMSETGKERSEVSRYFVAFWANYESIDDWQKIIDRIEKGEKKLIRLRLIRDSIQEKVERHLEDTFSSYFRKSNAELPSLKELLDCSWQTMKVQYPNGSRGKGYQDEEDAFLVCMMYRHGYGASERIRMEIRRAWQFRFNWWFKSRSTPEIQKRCDFLVRTIEKENDDLHKTEDGSGQGQLKQL